MNKIGVLLIMLAFTSCMQHQPWWPTKVKGDLSSRDYKKSSHFKQNKHID
jgi:hypothetical protein